MEYDFFDNGGMMVNFYAQERNKVGGKRGVVGEESRIGFVI